MKCTAQFIKGRWDQHAGERDINMQLQGLQAYFKAYKMNMYYVSFRFRVVDATDNSSS